MTDPDPLIPPNQLLTLPYERQSKTQRCSTRRLIRKLLCRNLFCTVVLAFVSFHPAYGIEHPDHTDALNQIRKLLTDDRYFEITNPKYVNGYVKDANNYIVAVTFTRVFKVSSNAFVNKPNHPKRGLCDNSTKIFGDAAYLDNLFGNFEPDDRFDEACQFSFLQTENGWILQDVEGEESVVARHTEHAAQQAEEAAQRQAREAIQKQKEAEAYGERNLIEVKNACASSQQLKITDNYGIGHLEDVDGKMLRDDKQYGIVPSNGQVVGCLPDIIYRNKILGYVQVPPVPMCHIQYSIGN